MSQPWVSILTPVFNGIEFLEECAMSVCLQNCSYDSTSFTWEWWIGINGHGIHGGDVLLQAKEIQRKCKGSIGDCVIHVVNLPFAKGKVEALNELVSQSKGDWIAVLDCDDTWERDKLLYQKLTVDISPYPIAVIGTLCRYFGEFESNGPNLPVALINNNYFWTGNPIINSSAIIKREYAHWESRFGLEDYDMWLRLSKKDLKFFNVPKRLVNHRIHKKSAFNGKGAQDVTGLLNYHLHNNT